MLDAVELLDESQPGRLRHIGRVGRVEAMPARDGPDHAREAVHELVPGVEVARSGRPHQVTDRDVPFIQIR